MNRQTRVEARLAGKPQQGCHYCYERGSETYVLGESFKLAWPCRCLTRQMPAHEARLKSLGDLVRYSYRVKHA